MIEPKPCIKKLFRIPPSSLGRAGKIFRLDRNEHTTPFPASHMKRIWKNMDPDEIVAYPELEPFYKKLSKWLGVDRQEVLISSGSDTAIKAVFEVYVEEGDEVVMFPPTYEMYAVYCGMFGAAKKEVFYNADFTLPLKRVIEAINSKTKLIIIANPNHPGTCFEESQLLEVLKTARNNHALVLIDEAYYHFCNLTMLPHIYKFDNLVIVRTFSKAFGIASLRVGYTVSNKSVITDLYKVKLTHEITAISAKFGEYLLDNPGIMTNYVADVKRGIKYLSSEFKKMGFYVPDTSANFLYARLPAGIDSKKIIARLKEKNFYIKGPFAVVPINGCIRITAGPVKQMYVFMRAFKTIYEKENQSQSKV
ncbi:MAG: histidinol-phosphate transaminase [Candidatus Omnitrophica bacterium]|nr:histidinol-phosphate transaminase [Candidatus Omnitrophota bacterium]